MGKTGKIRKMEPPFASPMRDLYSRLSGVGLTRPYVKATALPDWWDDEAGESPAGYAEALLHLARHLGLSLESLQAKRGPLALREFGPCKFKRTTGTTEDELALARTIGTRSAQLAATATATPFKGLPDSAAEIRLRILDKGAPWVGLKELLKYCWSVGVPVIFLARLPKTIKKMHGMSAMFKGRPVIVIAKNIKQPAWLLFILAHELGHIARGHLSDGSVLIDQDVDHNEPDAEEKEANEFALELITGEADFSVATTGRWPNASRLAELSKAVGTERHIDPGHIVLNYAHTMGTDFWGVANAALKHLEPGADAPGLIRKALAAKLDWSALPKDSSAFLMRVTKSEP
jgi:Zn-dependent peptidase ImmA (M78 family)